MALVLTLGAVLAEWAAKGIELGLHSSPGATKLVSMKALASSERRRLRHGTYMGPAWTKHKGRSVAAAS